LQTTVNLNLTPPTQCSHNGQPRNPPVWPHPLTEHHAKGLPGGSTAPFTPSQHEELTPTSRRLAGDWWDP